MLVKFLLPLFLIPILFACQKSDRAEMAEVEDPIFQLVDSSQSHVYFRNNIIEGLNTNVLMYEYFYNGGGVSAGDLNGDGKIDLYFSSNLENNHLYVNQGNLVFNEVGEMAGVTGRQGPWKTGVSLVDINGDHKLDIYLCYSGNLPPDKKSNQLFINQGNRPDGTPTFVDQASAYGLDSPANSTHAVFFDYDRDQDLDMILVNHNPKSLPVLDEASTADLLSKTDENSGIQFFKNEGPGKKFINRTQELGIQSSTLSYGLAVGISDVNLDGWPDFYVSNDYTIPDFLYINQQGKRFKNTINTSIGHFSHFSMGNDIADVNNDLLPDIFTLDMLPEDNLRQKLLMSPDNYEKFNFNLNVGFGHQYMRNMLQLNQGISSQNKQAMFSEIGQMAGISNTDWSWSALFADYDNDGWKDLYVTNGYLRDYTNLDFLKYMGDYIQNNQTSIQRENVLDMVQRMPASNVHNYMFKNTKEANFKQVSQAWGFDQASNSNGAAYADLDNDGDLELIVNNINRAAFIYENKSNEVKKQNHSIQLSLAGSGLNTLGLGAKIWVYQNSGSQYFEQNFYRGFQSSVSPLIHVGLGNSPKIDSIRVQWLSGKSSILKNVKPSGTIIFKESDAIHFTSSQSISAPIFVLKEALQSNSKNLFFNDFKRQTQLANPLSFSGPILTKGDVDQNGLADIFVGGSLGNPSYLYLNQPNGKYTKSTFPIPTDLEVTDASFFDADLDGDLDIYVVAGGYGDLEPSAPQLKDYFLLNNGKGAYKIASSPALIGSKSCVEVLDFNGDQLPDLFVGSRVIPGQYPISAPSYLLQNLGGGKFVNVSNRFPLLNQLGMVTDAQVADLGGDKKMELVVVGEFEPIRVFSFTKSNMVEVSSQYFDQAPRGFWNKLLIDDLDGDGNPEIMVGNLGLNSQWKASLKEPLEMYVKDFDGNGAIDPIMTTYVKGVKVPFMTRDELLDQISLMRSRFTDYQSFAEASLTDILTEDELKDVTILTIDELKTCLFKREKSGKFSQVKLPLAVQRAPIFSIQVLDFNADGKKDILLGGNMNQAKIRMGKMDANDGILLAGNGALTFNLVPQQKTGLWLSGDVRSMVNIGNEIFIGINQKGVSRFKLGVHAK